MRECVTCLLAFVFELQDQTYSEIGLELNFCLCLLEIVGKTKTGLSSEGFCFADRHFLPIFFKNFVLFCFSSSFFCKRKYNQVLSLYLFSPLLTGCVQSSGIGTVFAARN